jgi:hypothetical protein
MGIPQLIGSKMNRLSLPVSPYLPSRFGLLAATCAFAGLAAPAKATDEIQVYNAGLAALAQFTIPMARSSAKMAQP